MTLVRPPEDTITLGKTNSGNKDNTLQKRWSSTHIVQVYRKPNTNLGISIVGGKVRIRSDSNK